MTDYNLTLAKLDNGRSEKSLPETMVAPVQAGVSIPELQDLITLGLQASRFFGSLFDPRPLRTFCAILVYLVFCEAVCW